MPFRLQGGLRPGQPLGDPEARLDVAGRLERQGSLSARAVSGVARILHGTGWSSYFFKKKRTPGPDFGSPAAGAQGRWGGALLRGRVGLSLSLFTTT